MPVKIVSSVHGLNVLVAHSVQKNEEHLHRIDIVGLCGSSSHTKTWTIGAVDGARPDPPTSEELQNTLDEFRQEVADHAAWKERVGRNVANLK
jgi:hypothetical protein